MEVSKNKKWRTRMKKLLLAITLLSVAGINAQVKNKSGIYTPTILTPKAVMTQLIMPNDSETVYIL